MNFEFFLQTFHQCTGSDAQNFASIPGTEETRPHHKLCIKFSAFVSIMLKVFTANFNVLFPVIHAYICPSRISKLWKIVFEIISKHHSFLETSFIPFVSPNQIKSNLKEENSPWDPYRSM